MLGLALRRALIAAAAGRAPSSLLSSAVADAAAPSSTTTSTTTSTAAARLLWLRDPARPLSSAAAADEQQQQQQQHEESSKDESLSRLANKLVYRAKQRGFLELDLLVGLWAERFIPAARILPDSRAARARLLDAASLLDAENPDLFKWLTGQAEPPEHMARNSAFADLHAHVQGQMAEHSPLGARAAPGAAWARGWDDAWAQKQQQAGGQEGGQQQQEEEGK